MVGHGASTGLRTVIFGWDLVRQKVKHAALASFRLTV